MLDAHYGRDERYSIEIFYFFQKVEFSLDMLIARRPSRPSIIRKCYIGDEGYIMKVM